MNELITVIVPVYNVEKYINRCVDSIINQSYTNLEIILVDDGSLDNCGQICDKYANEDARVKVIHKKNGGLGFARNSGMEVSTGKYVMFVDGDDYIENNMVINLYTDLKNNKADTCIGGFRRVEKNQVIEVKNKFAGMQIIGDKILTDILAKMFGPDYVHNDFIEMSVWKVLFSNEIIKEHNLKFPSEREFISEDIIFDTEYYSFSNKVYMSSDCGYFYCDNGDSLTNSYRKDRFQKQIILNCELKRRAIILNILEDVKYRLDNLLIALARYSIKLEVLYSNKNGKMIVKENIKNICNSSELKEALAQYNDTGVRTFSKIINFMIKKQWINLLILVMKIKNALNI